MEGEQRKVVTEYDWTDSTRFLLAKFLSTNLSLANRIRPSQRTGPLAQEKGNEKKRGVSDSLGLPIDPGRSTLTPYGRECSYT